MDLWIMEYIRILATPLHSWVNHTSQVRVTSCFALQVSSEAE